MSLTTRNKRASCIGAFLPTPRLLPNPGTTVTRGLREQLANSYSQYVVTFIALPDPVVITSGLTAVVLKKAIVPSSSSVLWAEQTVSRRKLIAGSATSAVWSATTAERTKTCTAESGTCSFVVTSISRKKAKTLLPDSDVWVGTIPDALKVLEPVPGEGGSSFGYWSLYWGSVEVAQLQYDSSATAVHDALEGISGLSGKVTVENNTTGAFPTNGGGYVITFDPSIGTPQLWTSSHFHGGQYDYLVVFNTEQPPTEPVAAENEKIYFNVTGATYGSFTIAANHPTDGKLTAEVGFEASLEETISAVSGLFAGHGNYQCTGTGGPLNSGTGVTVEITNPSGTNIPDVYLDNTDTTDGSVDVHVTSQGDPGDPGDPSIMTLTMNVIPKTSAVESYWSIVNPEVIRGFYISSLACVYSSTGVTRLKKRSANYSQVLWSVPNVVIRGTFKPWFFKHQQVIG